MIAQFVARHEVILPNMGICHDHIPSCVCNFLETDGVCAAVLQNIQDVHDSLYYSPLKPDVVGEDADWSIYFLPL